MSRLHLRYLLVSFFATTLAALFAQIFIATILATQAAMAGAAFIAGWWGNAAMAFTVAILAGRKAAAEYVDPRIGKLAGTAVGVWVGVGALFGEAVAATIHRAMYAVDLRVGLVLVFGLVSFAVALVTATITGRETAHPPEEEA
jgi:hypothetical protein